MMISFMLLLFYLNVPIRIYTIPIENIAIIESINKQIIDK